MITFQITPDVGEPYEVTAGSRDIYTWELTTGRGKRFVEAVTNPAMVDLYQIAYIAVRRQELFTGTLKEFAESVELKSEESNDVDPTRPAA